MNERNPDLPRHDIGNHQKATRYQAAAEAINIYASVLFKNTVSDVSDRPIDWRGPLTMDLVPDEKDDDDWTFITLIEDPRSTDGLISPFFMVQLCKQFEQLDYVQEYAFYIMGDECLVISSSHIYDMEASLKELNTDDLVSIGSYMLNPNDQAECEVDYEDLEELLKLIATSTPRPAEV